MKKLLLIFLAIKVVFAISTSQAYKYIGESVEICGKVKEVFKHSNGHVFLNIDGKYPNQKMEFLIWHKYLKNFRGIDFLNKEICVKGLVREYRGRLQIFLKNKNQLRFK